MVAKHPFGGCRRLPEAGVEGGGVRLWAGSGRRDGHAGAEGGVEEAMERLGDYGCPLDKTHRERETERETERARERETERGVRET